MDSYKKPTTRLESLRVFLPKELPFEEGTGLSRQDACSRLTFQLLIERLLPEYTLDEEFEDEEIG